MTARPSRRGFLTAAGLVGLVGAAGACADAPLGGPPPPPTSPPMPPTPAPTTGDRSATWTGDAAGVALCAALSTFAAAIYTDAGAAAAQARYGVLPGVVTTFLTAASAQHTEHVAAWNEVLAGAGAPTVDGDEPTGADRFRTQLAAARAPVDLLTLAFDLESVAAATATATLGEIADPAAVAVTAGIAPVAAMRATTASFLLGRPPAVPGDPVAGALGRGDLTG